MTKALEGKTALVTGASRGIGRAIARRLAADGATVIAHYGRNRDAAESLVSEIETAGGRATAVEADLETVDGVERLAAETARLVGDRSLDILVNNAGVAEFAPLGDTDAASIDRQLAVNVRAPLLLTAKLAERMPEGGSVILLGSVVATRHFPALAAYAATKGAVHTLAIHLAAELGPRGVRVNAVAPGAIDTDMSAWLRSDEGAATALGIQALQRVGEAEDVARVVAFLAGPDAGWVTGQTIDASGGSKL